ncbi:MAG: dTDP-4-dehydrorhamnose 3,5-epimerase [Defluviitaleaceae bacterium]|nr:dTDP-4-dehydrorhamnose 3,5-epimerase [Defluviitaleaceae bacterium]
MITPFLFEQTEIPGLILIQPFTARDIRGDFTKDYSKEIFEKNDIDHNLMEVFYTNSYKGVVRALHFQRERQMPKLVRCLSGSIYDVIVDLRKNSHTFKKYQAFNLTGENKKQLLIPSGCAHGYLVLENSIVSYKCSEKFYAEYDDGIRWNDPDIGIEWPLDKIDVDVILSEKDIILQTFAEFMDKYGGF